MCLAGIKKKNKIVQIRSMLDLDGTLHTKEGIATCMANHYKYLGNHKPEDIHLFDDSFYKRINQELGDLIQQNECWNDLHQGINADITLK